MEKWSESVLRLKDFGYLFERCEGQSIVSKILYAEIASELLGMFLTACVHVVISSWNTKH